MDAQADNATPDATLDMLRAHARYCREQEAKRAAEGRYEVARRWRAEAQAVEARLEQRPAVGATT